MPGTPSHDARLSANAFAPSLCLLLAMIQALPGKQPLHPSATAGRTSPPFTFKGPSAATAALLVSIAVAMAAVLTRPRLLLMVAALILQQPLLVMPPTCLEGGVAAPRQLCLLLGLQVFPPLGAGKQVTAAVQLLFSALPF